MLIEEVYDSKKRTRRALKHLCYGNYIGLVEHAVIG